MTASLPQSGGISHRAPPSQTQMTSIQGHGRLVLLLLLRTQSVVVSAHSGTGLRARAGEHTDEAILADEWRFAGHAWRIK